MTYPSKNTLAYCLLLQIKTPSFHDSLSKKEKNHQSLLIFTLQQHLIKLRLPKFDLYSKDLNQLFFISLKEGGELEQELLEQEVGKKLIDFFNLFERKKQELQDLNLCSCRVCSNIWDFFLQLYLDSEKITLCDLNPCKKIQSQSFNLLTNLADEGLSQDEYLLITPSAYTQVGFPDNIQIIKSVELHSLENESMWLYFPHAFSNHLRHPITAAKSPCVPLKLLMETKKIWWQWKSFIFYKS
jgi:hypothetical protein